MRFAAVIGGASGLVCVALLASAQPGFQPPPDSFQTPSGNVHCLWRAGTLRCDVLEHGYETPPRPAGCVGDWGGRFALRPQGRAELLCEAADVRNDEAFVLGYGARWIVPGVACLSDEGGLSCANQAGHGFQVSRSRLRLF